MSSLTTTTKGFDHGKSCARAGELAVAVELVGSGLRMDGWRWMDGGLSRGRGARPPSAAFCQPVSRHRGKNSGSRRGVTARGRALMYRHTACRSGWFWYRGGAGADAQVPWGAEGRGSGRRWWLLIMMTAGCLEMRCDS